MSHGGCWPTDLSPRKRPFNSRVTFDPTPLNVVILRHYPEIFNQSEVDRTTLEFDLLMTFYPCLHRCFQKMNDHVYMTFEALTSWSLTKIPAKYQPVYKCCLTLTWSLTWPDPEKCPCGSHALQMACPVSMLIVRYL